MEELEKIEAQLNEVNAKRDELKAQAHLLAQKLDEVRGRIEAEAMVENMTDAQRTQLAQVVQAAAVESSSAVGTPGGNE